MLAKYLRPLCRACTLALACSTFAACAGRQTPPPLPAEAASRISEPRRTVSPIAVTVNTTARGAVISRDMIGFETQATQVSWGVAAAKALGATFNLYLPNTAQPGVTGIAAYEAAYIEPNHVDLMYRSDLNNPDCTGLLTPGQWANEVAQVNLVKHFNIKLWQIGFQPYVTDSPWCGPPPASYQDPGLYGALQASIGAAMKHVDPSIETGVVVGGSDADGGNSYWDKAVLATAKYDFISTAFPSSGSDLLAYPCTTPATDACVLASVIPDFDTKTSTLRNLLAAAGKPSTPMYDQEIGVTYNWGANNQSISIVGGLYYGLLTAEAMRLGYAGLGFVLFTGTPCFTGFPPNPNVYGWQNWGTTSIVSNGASCGSQAVPAGTPLPPARGIQLAAAFGHAGEHMLGTNVAAGGSVVAYGATQGSGYALFLFNLDPSNSVPVKVQLANAARTTFNAVEVSYDKSIYDQSKNNVWAAPVTTSLGAVGTTFTVALTPWSMNVVELK